MRKSHWEWLLSKYPQLATGVRWTGPAASVGIATRLGALKAKLIDRANAGHPILSVDRYAMDPCIASQFVAFETDGAPIFRLAREFGEDLAKVKLDIECRHLPITNRVICIEFPEHMRYHLGDQKYARCVYLFSTNEREMLIRENDPHPGRIREAYLHMLMPLYDASDLLSPGMEIQECGVSIYDLGVSVKDMIDQSLVQSSYRYTNRAFIDFVVNCLVYLHSGDPDLRQYRAPRPPKTHKPKVQRLWAREHENQSLVDMTLVGYEWKKMREYHVGETVRRGHARWQPYGPRTEPKVKLIWIEPHVVRYRGVQQADEPQASQAVGSKTTEGGPNEERQS